MRLIVCVPRWGHEHLPVAEFLDRAAASGFDGVEMGLVEDFDLERACRERGLKLVVQLHSAGQDAAAHGSGLTSAIARAAATGALLVNAHAGSDAFSLADNLRVIATALDAAAAAAAGVALTIETHRSRATATATATRELLLAEPRLRLTADLSHWLCVHAGLDAHRAALDLALSRSDHVHARVGNRNGPQVADPRAPLWQAELHQHLAWWSTIIERHRAAGANHLTVTCEHGPPTYQVCDPWTGQPLADQWQVNCWMAEQIRRC